MDKKVKLLICLCAMLLIGMATFFFLIPNKGSPTGLSIDIDNKTDLPSNCWRIADGRVICKLKMVSVPPGEISIKNFDIGQ